MKIAVLSGKGGTGKTLISVNMAAVLQKSVYVDCDVEEPNGHLFFKPVDVRSEKVSVKIPVADDNLCNGCRKCVDFCKYNALVYVNDRLMVFEDICHSCGGCVLLCPERALSERDKVIGEVRGGVSENVTIISGVLNTGEVSGTPIIKELISRISREERPVIIDCPPGSACIVMESIKDADYCILVAEPTLFGVHNLDMVCELVRLFDKPYGVIVNKCMDGKTRRKNTVSKTESGFWENTLRRGTGQAEFQWPDCGLVESKRYRELFKSLYQKVAGEVQA